MAGWEVGLMAYQYARGRMVYKVAVAGLDEAYDVVAAWLTTEVPSRARRSLVVSTRRRGDDSVPAPADPGDVPASPPMRAQYDGSSQQTVRVDGHRVHVQVERHSASEGLNLSINGGQGGWERALRQITFTCYGAAARDSVLALLDRLTNEAFSGAKARPRMWVATRWSEWTRVREVPVRRLDSVVLADGQQDRIVADLEKFFAAEKLYGRVGLPWHRGLLFHGPPGCGKTSLATALADRFGLDVYLLPLSDLEADTNLMQLLGNVDPRSVLVIEDIDVVHAAKARDDSERKGVTLSGLLNALDGLVTPHGLVTIMTTNKLDALDAALVRPGRADLVEEFGPLDQDQADRLCVLIAEDHAVPLPGIADGELTHAELLEAAKPYLGDPGAACRAMIERVWRARAETPLDALDVDVP
jgi:hypothetical protein